MALPGLIYSSAAATSDDVASNKPIVLVNYTPISGANSTPAVIFNRLMWNDEQGETVSAPITLTGAAAAQKQLLA